MSDIKCHTGSSKSGGQGGAELTHKTCRATAPSARSLFVNTSVGNSCTAARGTHIIRAVQIQQRMMGKGQRTRMEDIQVSAGGGWNLKILGYGTINRGGMSTEDSERCDPSLCILGVLPTEPRFQPQASSSHQILSPAVTQQHIWSVDWTDTIQGTRLTYNHTVF